MRASGHSQSMEGPQSFPTEMFFASSLLVTERNSLGRFGKNFTFIEYRTFSWHEH